MVAAGAELKQRVVLLGASNLTRGLPVVLRTLHQLLDGPIEVLAAAGRGRSYGMKSNFLGRSLPGILHCGLWDELSRIEPRPTTALITDVGNDLLYEAPVEKIVEWVERCCDRLAAGTTRLALTGLPVCNLNSLSQPRFKFFRSLFVPGCQLTLADVIGRANQLDERLRTLAQERGLAWIAQQADWFGIDPIHIRMATWPAAWRTILSPLRPATVDAHVNGAAGHNGHTPWSPLMWLRTTFALPQQSGLFGHPRQRAQPCLIMPNGSRLSLY
ncbi:MAG: hypothetical protein JSS27_19190 [Planctomycetes bacterium]|nr:hypothetical protein [Planctomycetota bacterium]